MKISGVVMGVSCNTRPGMKPMCHSFSFHLLHRI